MRAEPAADGPEAAGGRRFSGGGPQIPGKRVLVVDDDRDTLALLGEFAGRLGIDVVKAHNGSEAYDKFRGGRFDLVVTDLQMPVLDGLELLAKIKAVSRQTPVVLITGQSIERVKRSGRASAAAAVLQKPFDLMELEQVFQTAMTVSR